MSSQIKAERFAAKAESHGWAAVVTEEDEETEHWAVECKRGGERITIFWVQNMLVETPKYYYAGTMISLHNNSDASKQLALDPDPTRAAKRASRKPSGAERSLQDGAIAVDPRTFERSLPFDIETDPDGKILKALRGATIMWYNELCRRIDSSLIPYKVADGTDSKGRPRWRLFNVDLEDVFYLAENENGAPYVSFMDINGQFRAVYLNAILEVS